MFIENSSIDKIYKCRRLIEWREILASKLRENKIIGHKIRAHKNACLVDKIKVFQVDDFKILAHRQ